MHSHLRVWFTLWLGLSLVTTAQAARHAVLIGVDYQDYRPASPGITCPPPLAGAATYSVQECLATWSGAGG